jgi:hypothetical protein
VCEDISKQGIEGGIVDVGEQRASFKLSRTTTLEEAQVDYGTGPMVRESPGGKYRRTRLFVLTLGYSREWVLSLVWRSSARVWAEHHEKACQMAMAFRPRPSPCSISARFGSQALVARSCWAVGGEIG